MDYGVDYGDTCNNPQFSHAYNPANQIASQTRSNDAYAWTGQAAVSRNYTPNGLNEYTAVGGISFSYDANGNLTSDGTNTFTYDVENRLVGGYPRAGSYTFNHCQD